MRKITITNKHIKLAKNVAQLVVGSGTSYITAAVIKNNVPSPEKLHQKLAVAAASLVIGSLVSDATRKHTGKKIEEAVNWARDFTNKAKDTWDENEAKTIDAINNKQD